MPTHNRPRNLAALLASLDNQTLENFEVLVVDDNSNPPAQVPTLPNLTLLRTEGIERCRARNLGANQARGEVLLFLDDDLTFGPDFLALHVEAHQKTLGAVVVGGLELPTTAKNTPFGRFRFEMERQNAPPAGEVKTPTFATANLSLSRADFLALEGFDAQILCGEDQDLLARAQTRGTKLFFLPQALTIHHDHAVDLETYLKRMEWGAKTWPGFTRATPTGRTHSPPTNQRAAKIGPRITPAVFAQNFQSRTGRAIFGSRGALFGAPKSQKPIFAADLPIFDWCGDPARLPRGGPTMKTVLHLAQFNDTSGLFPGLARHHDAQKYKMLFATLRPMETTLRAEMEALKVPIWDSGSRSRREYGSGLERLRRFLRREKVDILHAHFFEPTYVGLPAALAARTPLRVMTRHLAEFHKELNRPLHVQVDRLTTAMSHAVICPSHATAKYLVEGEGAPPQKLRVVPNGVPSERLRVEPEKVANLRRELGGEEGALLLCVARFAPEKGLAELFQALAKVQKRAARPFKLLHAGTGPREQQYRDMARELGLQNIEFLGFRRDVTEIMAASDLLIFPSHNEAFGLALVESLMLGTPAVTSEVGIAPDVLNGQNGGTLVAPRDVEGLAAAILEFLNAPAQLAAQKATLETRRAEIRAQFSFEQMVRGYESVYEEFWPR